VEEYTGERERSQVGRVFAVLVTSLLVN